MSGPSLVILVAIVVALYEAYQKARTRVRNGINFVAKVMDDEFKTWAIIQDA